MTSKSSNIPLVCTLSKISVASFPAKSKIGTVGGKVITCILAVFGGAHFSAVFMVISQHVVNNTTHIAHFCLGSKFNEKKHDQNRLCVLLSAMLLYLIIFSGIVCLLMEWPFFTSLYYSMITFTTVGLGFYAPSFSEATDKSDAEMSFVLVIIIILTLVGMALLAGLISEIVADRYLYTKVFGGLFRFNKVLGGNRNKDSDNNNNNNTLNNFDIEKKKNAEEKAKLVEDDDDIVDNEEEEEEEEEEDTSTCIMIKLCFSLCIQMILAGILLHFCEYETEVETNAVAVEEYSRIGHVFYLNDTGVLISPKERYIISTYLSIPTRGHSNWAFSGSLFYATTIFTTIGYVSKYIICIPLNL